MRTMVATLRPPGCSVIQTIGISDNHAYVLYFLCMEVCRYRFVCSAHILIDPPADRHGWLQNEREFLIRNVGENTLCMMRISILIKMEVTRRMSGRKFRLSCSDLDYLFNNEDAITNELLCPGLMRYEEHGIVATHKRGSASSTKRGWSRPSVTVAPQEWLYPYKRIIPVFVGQDAAESSAMMKCQYSCHDG